MQINRIAIVFVNHRRAGELVELTDGSLSGAELYTFTYDADYLLYGIPIGHH